MASLYPLAVLGLLALLAAAARRDLAERRIPNALCAAVAALGAAAVVLWPDLHRPLPSLASAALPGLLLLAGWTRGMIGGGDVKLAAALGLWMDGEAGGFLLAASVAGGIAALAALAARRPGGGGERFAYGPAIAAGGLAAFPHWGEAAAACAALAGTV